MAAKKSSREVYLNVPPPETIVDVVSMKGDRVIVTAMPYSEAAKIKRNHKGWINHLYQQGFHSFKTTNNDENGKQ